MKREKGTIGYVNIYYKQNILQHNFTFHIWQFFYKLGQRVYLTISLHTRPAAGWISWKFYRLTILMLSRDLATETWSFNFPFMVLVRVRSENFFASPETLFCWYSNLATLMRCLIRSQLKYQLDDPRNERVRPSWRSTARTTEAIFWTHSALFSSIGRLAFSWSNKPSAFGFPHLARSVTKTGTAKSRSMLRSPFVLQKT